MAGEWKEMTLADISRDVSYGYTESASTEPIGPKFLRITDIQGGVVNWKTVPHCQINEDDHKRYALSAGDIVVARTGNSTGENYLFGGDEDAVFASFLIRFRLNQTQVEPKFVWYNMRTSSWWDFINSSKTGSAQAGANAKVLGRFPLKLPSIHEQRAIARILGTLDDKIELNRKMNETLEAMARALFKSWFVDFNPVRAKAEGRDTGLPKEIADLFPDSFVDSELGEIPKGWSVSALEEHLSVLETGGRPKGGVSGYSEGIPSIGAESIVGLGIFDYGKTKYVPFEYFKGMTRGRIEDRDVLLYKDGGRPGEFEPHVTMFGNGFPFKVCAINEHVYRMRTDNAIGQEYLYFWMSSELIMDEMRMKGTGVAIPGLNSTQVKSLTFLLPPKNVLSEFKIMTDKVIDRSLANSNQSRNLSQIRDALLPKLISGELRIKNPARNVPAIP